LKINSVLIVCLVSACFSCEFIKEKINLREREQEESKPEPIARANDIYLYPEDLVGLVSDELSPDDSTQRVNQMVQSWIKKQLVIAEAQARLDLDEAELERKLLDYKYALMIHEFERQYVNRELDKEVTSEEIKSYYQKNIDNFKLNKDIVKAIFVQLPKGSPNLGKFRSLIKSNNPNDRDELKSYCHRYATKAHLGDSNWVYFEQIAVNTPLQEEINNNDFLQNNNKYKEFEDEESLYFLKISEYRVINDISPLDFVWDEIEKIILNKRKVKLVNELENNIYERAEKNRDFEIYTEE